MAGFIKMLRTVELKMLLRKPNEFTLLSIIAVRANRGGDFNIYGLKEGEALIGDYENYGMSRQTYRTSKTNLQKKGYITTKITNKGTVAKLLLNPIFDINESSSNQQGNHPTTNKVTTQQPLTRSKEIKNEKKDIYGEFKNVFLTTDERVRGVEKVGEKKFFELVERLSCYIEQQGKDKYKSHYATLLNWHRKDQPQNIPPEFRKMKGEDKTDYFVRLINEGIDVEDIKQEYLTQFK